MFNCSGSAIDLVQWLSDLITEQAKWSQETFGSDDVRGPEGVLKHLAKEADEAINEWQTVLACNDVVDLELLSKCIYNFREEMADCFILLLDAMRRSKVLTFSQLVECAYVKLQKNKKRDWPKNTSLTEPVEHLEE